MMFVVSIQEIKHGGDIKLYADRNKYWFDRIDWFASLVWASKDVQVMQLSMFDWSRIQKTTNQTFGLCILLVSKIFSWQARSSQAFSFCLQKYNTLKAFNENINGKYGELKQIRRKKQVYVVIPKNVVMHVGGASNGRLDLMPLHMGAHFGWEHGVGVWFDNGQSFLARPWNPSGLEMVWLIKVAEYWLKASICIALEKKEHQMNQT